MKKNITINLCGRLFQIDEDAYELLQHNIESLRHSFGKSEGATRLSMTSKHVLQNCLLNFANRATRLSLSTT